MTATLHRVGRSLGRRQRWVWAIPLPVFLLVLVDHAHLAVLVAILFGTGFLVLVGRRPAAAISALLVLLVFNTALLAVLFRIGLPASVVRGLGYWKEGVVIGALLELIRRAKPLRPDALDIVAGTYAALGTLYLLLPRLAVGHAIGSSISLSNRALGWRSDVVYVAIFLIVRHLRFERRTIEAIFRRLLVVAVVAAVAGVLELVASGTWNHVAVSDLGVQTYRHIVLHQQPGPGFHLDDVRVYGHIGSHQFVRIGSVLFDYLGIGFIFVIGLGTAAELIVRGRASRWIYAAFPVMIVALLLTQTRSAILAGAAATVWALWPRAGRLRSQRIRFARILAVLVVAVVPLALATGALDRFSGGTGSNSEHRSGFTAGISVMGANPLGRGLSTGAGGGQLVVQRQRGVTPVVFVTEDQYLQVGTQLGIAGLVLYLATVVLLLRRLLARSPADASTFAPPAMANIAVGTLLGAIFTLPFVGVDVAWIFWGLAGLAISALDHPATTTMPPIASLTRRSWS
ncbi:MAG: O-antigen ligase family protein [Actinomycetota bacterium]|nr:O-antigen ligase family protein [Actinomycetota bacterium]